MRKAENTEDKILAAVGIKAYHKLTNVSDDELNQIITQCVDRINKRIQELHTDRPPANIVLFEKKLRENLSSCHLTLPVTFSDGLYVPKLCERLSPHNGTSVTVRVIFPCFSLGLEEVRTLLLSVLTYENLTRELESKRMFLLQSLERKQKI